MGGAGLGHFHPWVAWPVLLLAGFAVLFPDLVAGNLSIDAKLVRLFAALIVAAEAVFLSDYYFRWSEGLI